MPLGLGLVVQEPFHLIERLVVLGVAVVLQVGQPLAGALRPQCGHDVQAPGEPAHRSGRGSHRGESSAIAARTQLPRPRGHQPAHDVRIGDEPLPHETEPLALLEQQVQHVRGHRLAGAHDDHLAPRAAINLRRLLLRQRGPDREQHVRIIETGRRRLLAQNLHHGVQVLVRRKIIRKADEVRGNKIDTLPLVRDAPRIRLQRVHVECEQKRLQGLDVGVPGLDERRTGIILASGLAALEKHGQPPVPHERPKVALEEFTAGVVPPRYVLGVVFFVHEQRAVGETLVFFDQRQFFLDLLGDVFGNRRIGCGFRKVRNGQKLPGNSQERHVPPGRLLQVAFRHLVEPHGILQKQVRDFENITIEEGLLQGHQQFIKLNVVEVQPGIYRHEAGHR